MNREKLIRYLSGDATPEEKEKVILWLDAAPENMREFMTLRKVHDIVIWQNSDVKDLRKAVSVSKMRVSIRKIISEAIKIAAVFIFGFFVFKVFFHDNKTQEVKLQTIHVPAGQRAYITLADGSNVWLNANTTFIFPTIFNVKNREVILQGEGYFDVATVKEQPFIVKTNDFDIEVFGTEFNVRAYSGTTDFEVALLEGSVEVKKTNVEEGVVLKPNQRLFIKDNRLFTSSIIHTNYFLWKDGIISFDDDTFPEIVKKLELYFDIKIEVKNDLILQYRCTGKFRSKDGVEHILKVLQLRNSFIYTINDRLNVITIK